MIRVVKTDIENGSVEQMTLPMTTRRERIVALLTHGLSPLQLDVTDDSARHAGHAGAREAAALGGAGGETHFNVVVTSERFNGLGRVARHRLVQDLLSDEFQRGLHALSLTVHGTDPS